METEILPFITVVMPVKNEECFIAKTLEELINQDYPASLFEIIVADGMSGDRTREIVESYMQNHPNIRIIDNPNQHSSAGRNVGFRNGKGDIFLVVDGHCCIPTNNLLFSIAECLKQNHADCLCRPQPLDPPDINLFQRAVALARGSKIGHGGDSLIYSDFEGFVSPVSHGAIYCKHIFEKIGYVDEDFDACEDVEFNYRVEKAGFKSYMSPKLTIKYYPRENLLALFRQMVRYGTGRIRFMRKHPDAMQFLSLVPLGFVFGILVLATLGLISHFARKLLCAICGLYLLIISLYSIMLTRKHGLCYLGIFPPIYFAIHFGLGWGQLTGIKEWIKSFILRASNK